MTISGGISAGRTEENLRDELIGDLPYKLTSALSAMTERLWRSFFLHKSKAMDWKTIELLCALGCLAVPSVAAFIVFAASIAAGRGKGYENKD